MQYTIMQYTNDTDLDDMEHCGMIIIIIIIIIRSYCLTDIAERSRTLSPQASQHLDGESTRNYKCVL